MPLSHFLLSAQWLCILSLKLSLINPSVPKGLFPLLNSKVRWGCQSRSWTYKKMFVIMLTHCIQTHKDLHSFYVNWKQLICFTMPDGISGKLMRDDFGFHRVFTVFYEGFVFFLLVWIYTPFLITLITFSYIGLVILRSFMLPSQLFSLMFFLVYL